MNIRSTIIDFMEEKIYKPMLKEELAVQFDIDLKDLEDFYKVIEGMEKEGIIIKTRNERYGLADKMNLLVGVLEGNEKGFGFVVPDDKTKGDAFISPENMNGALHGDRVVARIIKRQEVGKREEGEIIRILERVNKTIVGTFESNKSFGFVVPDDHKISYDIFIPKAYMKDAKTNQKVVVEIMKWPDQRRNPEGRCCVPA